MSGGAPCAQPPINQQDIDKTSHNLFLCEYDYLDVSPVLMLHTVIIQFMESSMFDIENGCCCLYLIAVLALNTSMFDMAS